MKARPLAMFGFLTTALTVGCSSGRGDLPGSSGSSEPSATSAAAVTCPASPAPGLFAGALCLCHDYDSVGAALVTPSTSGATASVGVNGTSMVVGDNQIDGDWIAYGGMSGVGQVQASGSVVSTQTIEGVGSLSVGGDLDVGGDLLDVGEVSVGGTLRVAGSDQLLGLGSAQTKGPYSPPAGPPCPCDPATFLDVAKLVAQAAASNDDAKNGLSPDIASVGAGALHLTSGSYYFTGVTSVGSLHVQVDGVVALYLDGSLQTVGADVFQLSSGSTLDVYVSGSVATVGTLDLGDPQHPSDFRLYVGGSSPLVLGVGEQGYSGMLYAPQATLSYVGHTVIRGAVFADRLSSVGELEVTYDAAQASPPGPQGQCTSSPPSSGSTTPPSTANAPDPGGPGSSPQEPAR